MDTKANTPDDNVRQLRRKQSPTSTTTVSFEAVISTWSERPRCEINTRSGNQCRNAAGWRTDIHGCDRRLICTAHLKSWEAKTSAVLAAQGRTLCRGCRRVFTHMSDIYTVRGL